MDASRVYHKWIWVYWGPRNACQPTQLDANEDHQRAIHNALHGSKYMQEQGLWSHCEAYNSAAQESAQHVHMLGRLGCSDDQMCLLHAVMS